jgi:hypothetical protein
MTTSSFDLGPNPHLVFRSCVGDLRIRAWGENQVQLWLDQEPETGDVQEAEGALEVSTTGPVTAQVPAETTVVVKGSVGDLHVTGLSKLSVTDHRGDLTATSCGRLELATLHGDVRVRDSQYLDVQSLNGDLRVGAAQGEARVAGVRGDVSLRGLSGQVSAFNITGSLAIYHVDGRLDVHDVDGDIQLKATLQSGHYAIQTNGDVALYLGPQSNVHVELEAAAGRISSTAQLQNVKEAPDRLTGDLGEGAAQLTVAAASGNIRLHQAKVGDLQEEIERESARAEAYARREAERAQRMADKMRRKGERLAEKARRRSERAARKARKHAAKARDWRVEWSVRGTSGAADNLEQERLAVLRMLGEGTINAEQAEALLQALEE